MISLDVYGTLVVASLVLLTGRKFVESVRLLRTYSIPEPVVGGLVVALTLYALQAGAGLQIRFDSSLGAPLMLDFAAISLSDLLVPWEGIRRRLEAAAYSKRYGWTFVEDRAAALVIESIIHPAPLPAA